MLNNMVAVKRLLRRIRDRVCEPPETAAVAPSAAGA